MRYFVWKFKADLWNSTQNILPIHWKIRLIRLHTMLTICQIYEFVCFFFKRPTLDTKWLRANSGAIMMTSSNGKFSVLLALCAGNSQVTGEFPTQRPVTRTFDVFFDLYLNKRLRKQSWGWRFEMPSRPLWRHCNVIKLTEKPIQYKYSNFREHGFLLYRNIISRPSNLYIGAPMMIR